MHNIKTTPNQSPQNCVGKQVFFRKNPFDSDIYSAVIEQAPLGGRVIFREGSEQRKNAEGDWVRVNDLTAPNKGAYYLAECHVPPKR
jgi:hypothetical protein